MCTALSFLAWWVASILICVKCSGGLPNSINSLLYARENNTENFISLTRSYVQDLENNIMEEIPFMVKNNLDILMINGDGFNDSIWDKTVFSLCKETIQIMKFDELAVCYFLFEFDTNFSFRQTVYKKAKCWNASKGLTGFFKISDEIYEIVEYIFADPTKPCSTITEFSIRHV